MRLEVGGVCPGKCHLLFDLRISRWGNHVPSIPVSPSSSKCTPAASPYKVGGFDALVGVKS